MINLEEETICGYEVSSKMKRIWAMELDMAKKFTDVCEEYKLKYWIMGGTLLGAVRHKGFIPWDNDMDFAMPRKDFDKLLEIGPEVFHDPLFFQTPVTEKAKYFRTFVRIRNGNGTAAFKAEYDLGINCGIFIDIFCLDEIPDSLIRRKWYFRKINEIAKMARFALGKTLSGGWRNCIKHSLQRLVYTSVYKRPDSAELFSIYQREASKYAGLDKQCLAHHAFGYNSHYVWSRKDWEETIFMPFEDVLLRAPKGYDAILRHQYGDYMQIPDDKSTHEYYAFNPDIPYSKFPQEQLLS